MQRIDEAHRHDRSRTFSRFLLVTFVTLGLSAIAQSIPSRVMAAEQLTFTSPDAAVDALVAAVAADDVEKLFDIFGREYKSELIGGDEIAFRENRKILAGALAQAASLYDDDVDTKTLIVGAKAWPFPFPIVRQAGVWRFDTEAGIEEVINRRIGRNELGAIEICRVYINAQVQYASADRDADDVREFAQKVASQEGQKDGLYWEAGDGEELSPFGPLVAEARNYLEGREVGDPFHGYYYKIITRQGAKAPGGRYDYIINGNMIAGFALIAFPAEHGNSGVMTFICSHQGKVYEKDLGEDSDLIAAGIGVYNPDSTWSEVRD
ncbi:MAG: DUF2950 domain-containing protein [Alphaproteobacteria bacterium]|nr:DUF2950 domain-containing protein [Alphaproteobacteria bacterium]MCZ6838119.1 DUF2950 domain-containing protein [Alphaproteobacteria bacterium]